MFPDEDWVHKSFLMLVWFEICLSCTSSYSSVLKNADINALFNYCYKEMVFDPSWDISGSSCGLGYGYSFAIEVEAICGEGGGLGVFSELFVTIQNNTDIVNNQVLVFLGYRQVLLANPWTTHQGYEISHGCIKLLCFIIIALLPSMESYGSRNLNVF